MDEQNHHQVSTVGRTTCSCGMGCDCSCHHHHGYRVLRWILGIVILFFVFAIGVKVGEFITQIRYLVGSGNFGYGYHTMMYDGGYMGVGTPVPPTTTTPSAGATATKTNP